MAYWLMKSEPDVFGIDDLAKRPAKTTHWDGVRNFQARNFMRDEMHRGDLAFFYHSSCDEPGVAGIVKIVKEGYPDHTAFDCGRPALRSRQRSRQAALVHGRRATAAQVSAHDHARNAAPTREARAERACTAEARQSLVDHAGRRCTLEVHSRSRAVSATRCENSLVIRCKRVCNQSHSMFVCVR